MGNGDGNQSSDEFVQNFDVLLYLFSLNGLLCVEDGERRGWSAIVNIATTWLEQTADEDDFEEGVQRLTVPGESITSSHAFMRYASFP